MNPIDIAVIVCVCVLVAAVAAYLIYRKVKHKGSGCCGSCSECNMCAHAQKPKEPDKPQTNADASASEPPADAPACPHCKK